MDRLGGVVAIQEHYVDATRGEARRRVDRPVPDRDDVLGEIGEGLDVRTEGALQRPADDVFVPARL